MVWTDFGAGQLGIFCSIKRVGDISHLQKLSVLKLKMLKKTAE